MRAFEILHRRLEGQDVTDRRPDARVARGPLMDPDDYKLSMAISPRARRPEDNVGMRTLLVNRLSGATKAVARMSFRDGTVSVFCEPCHKWIKQPDKEFPLEWDCPHCGRAYAMEFAVLEEVDEE